MSPETRLAPLLVRQDGLITLAQAADAGVSSRTLQRRVRSGGWKRVRAAGLWAGPPGAVSGPAAAWWHGMLPAAPDVVELTAPRDRCPRPQQGVCLRRRELTSRDLVKLRGLWVTDRPLTALETAATVADGSVFLDRALQRHVSFTRVYRAYCRNLGARGSARAGELLVAGAAAAADRADSAAERLAVALLRAAKITGWVLGYRFGRYVIDIAFPEAMLAVEIDGWAWHMGVDLSQPPGTATMHMTCGLWQGRA